MPRRPARPSKKISRRRQKRSSWKKLKLAKKLRRRLKIIGLALLTLVLTTAALSAISLYQLLKAPLASANPGASPRVTTAWRGQQPINLWLTSGEEEPTLLHFNPLTGKDVALTLPAGTNPEIDLGLKIAATLNLTPTGLTRLTTLTGVADLTQTNQIISLTTVVNLKEILRTLRENATTDLTLPEILLIVKYLTENPLTETDLYRLTERYRVEPLIFDAFWQDYAFNPVITEEGQKILVLNGTRIAGRASQIARILTNHGASILATANTTQTYEESLIIADQPDSATARLVAEITNIETILEKNVDNEVLEERILRSPITVILGWDQVD